MPSDGPTRNLAPLAPIPESIPGVLDVLWIDGEDADPQATPTLLVEVPHGADRRAHYDALRRALQGPYPEDLHVFFHVNTDVGAWQLGVRVAERLVAAQPTYRVLLLRSLIPRTFIDCNRVADAPASGDLGGTGLTGAMPPYVRDPVDQALLAELHERYVSAAEDAYTWVCGNGGLALNPHTYGPRTLAVRAVTDDIVADLHDAHEPDVYAASPLRPQVDLIMRTEDGTYLGPPGAEEALLQAFDDAGLEARVSETYVLHPITQGHRFAMAHPGQVIGLEVRRDLLVREWLPFREQEIDPEAVDRAAAPLASVIEVVLEATSGASAR